MTHQPPLEDSPPGRHPSLLEVADARRRHWLRGGLAAGLGVLLGPLTGCARRDGPGALAAGRLGFESVPMGIDQPLRVPPGYVAQVLYRWGDAVGIDGHMPPFHLDGSNTAAEQALQAGMHHDGMAYFALDGSPRHGLLAVNHEYTDEQLLHPGGVVRGAARVPEQVAKSMASHGVSVVEVQGGEAGRWALVRPSRFARRITAATPMALQGPAAGHALMRTAADPQGRQVLGTFANCAGNATPWGTYLTCEENFHYYFEPPPEPDAHQRRWGLKPGSNLMQWHGAEPRFDLRLHPNEFNRFGWVVEIDPLDPASTPVKRTALGRAAHEGAATTLTHDGRAAVFMGEDAAFEYLYRFISRDAVRPGGLAANRELLDHGTLAVARFDADGRGVWLPLVWGQGPLTPANGFADQGEVLIKARQASDLLGATRMDRPEWTAIDPASGHVYVSLTNNGARGRAGLPGADAANPRAPNPLGHVLRWRHQGDFDAGGFDWDLFALGGEAAGDAFGSPDGLMVDPRGVLWVATDAPVTPSLPRNQLLACDPQQPGGPVMKRFLVGPPGCEITGPVMAPDGRTLFLNIQHPGERLRMQPPYPDAWPQPGEPPRSATLAITRMDGGLIGS